MKTSLHLVVSTVLISQLTGCDSGPDVSTGSERIPPLFDASILSESTALVESTALSESTAQSESTVTGIRFQETTNQSNFDKTESWGASWAYIDADLYPDLFVGNHRTKVSIFRNNRNGSFTNIIDNADDGTFTGSLSSEYLDTHGTAFADVDEDGDQDFVTLTSAGRSAVLMLNDGTGKFTNATEAYGMTNDFEGRTPHWLDYDNDGKMDLLMTSGTVRLFKNDGVPPWVEQSEPTRLLSFCQRDQWFSISDIDKNAEGMEFLCGREGDWPGATLNYDQSGNNGQGAFRPNSILGRPALSHAVDSVAADFNGDLLPDMFVTRGAIMPSQAKLINPRRLESWVWTGTNSGLRTIKFNAPGRLRVEVHSNQTAQAHLIQIGANGENPANDGGDINKTSFTVDTGDPAHRGVFYLDQISPVERDAWLRTSAAKKTFIGHDGNGNWTFTVSPGDVSARVLFVIDAVDSDITGLTDSFTGVIGSVPQDNPLYPGLLLNRGGSFTGNVYTNRVYPRPAKKRRCVSVVAADFDNDMDQDIYMVCRGGIENIANVFLQNDGNGNFTEVFSHGAEGGIGAGIRSGWAQGENVVTADYDLDGKIDLFVTNGITLQPLRQGGQDQLFRNISANNNSWVQVLLKGTESNIEGIGAQVIVTAGGIRQLREQNDGIHRWSQNLKRLHFGLGNAREFDIEVSWPSGRVDRFNGVAANEFYNIVEGGPRPQPLDRDSSNPGSPENTLSSVVAQSVDDAVQVNTDDSMILNGASLLMVGGGGLHQAGMVFRDINIPSNAQITEAYIEFTAAQSNSDQTSLLLEGHATHYTGVFKPNSDDIGFRARTDAHINWDNIPQWLFGQKYRSPNIANIIQETVNRTQWEAGNALAILVSDNGSGRGTRNAVSFDGRQSDAPKLTIKWR